ncbi:MAG TPA: hypothetical protein VFR11_19950 [Micromonosporaceae bacterium]|nr:hypothetical protein [Micromonosporaceae bacterium]
MLTFVVVIELVGGACLLAGITALTLGVFALHDHRVVARTTLTPIGSWDGTARRRAAIATTAYGPGGRYVAPITGEDCAWYAAELIRVPSRRLSEESIGEDSLWRSVAPSPAAIADPTGSALLDPHLAESPPTRHDIPIVDVALEIYRPETVETMPECVPAHAYMDVRGYESLRLTEVRVPAGRRAYVLGATVQRGPYVMLVAAGHGPTIVTRDSPDEVRLRQRRSARDSRRLARGLTIVGATLSMLATTLLYVLPAA